MYDRSKPESLHKKFNIFYLFGHGMNNPSLSVYIYTPYRKKIPLWAL